jgi:anti-sigma B factor antagonist
MSFSYTISKEEEIVIVYLEGNLIANHQIDDLQNELDFHLNDEDLKLVLDLSKMEYMNSTGLGVLIHIFTQVRNNGGEVVLVNIPENINKLLLITKLNSIFNVEETLEDAKKILV